MAIQKTLVIVKPHVVEGGEAFRVLAELEPTLCPIYAAMVVPTEEQIREHCLGKEDDSYDGLVKHWLGKPVVVTVFAGDRAVLRARSLIGPADPDDAVRIAPKSIRAEYGYDVRDNAIHASDSVKAARREIKIWVPNSRLLLRPFKRVSGY